MAMETSVKEEGGSMASLNDDMRMLVAGWSGEEG